MPTAHSRIKTGQLAFENADYAKAASEFLPLAKEGNPVAQYWVARMFHEGRGLPENNAVAFNWAKRSAMKGNGDGEALLGTLYAQGQGTPRNDDEAARWFHKAALRGNALGQCKMGLCCLRGFGVPRDDVAAYMWFDLAASRSAGHEQKCNYNLRDVFAAMNLTPELIEHAKQLALKWKPEHSGILRQLHIA